MRKAMIAFGVLAGLGGAAAADGEGTQEVGLDLALLPTGSIHTRIDTPLGASEGQVDTATAFAIGGAVGIRSSLLSVALAPRYIVGVEGKDATGDAASELDLRVRLAVGARVAPRVSLRGYVAPGYSVVFPAGDGDKPQGFAVGFGGLLGLALSPGLELTVDLGYAKGFQRVTSTLLGQTVTADVGTDFLNLGVGVALVR